MSTDAGGSGRAGEVSEATERAGEEDASVAAAADRPPTAEEERLAEGNEPVDPSVAQHEREMDEIGANVKGEGEIE